MGQHHLPGIGPLLELVLPALDAVRGLGVDRIAVGELDRGAEHLGERERAELGEHQHQAARSPRRDRGQRAVGRRKVEPPGAEERRRGPRGREAEAVDGDDPAAAGVVDQRLGLAAPGEHVPHRRGRRDHGAGRVHGVAAALEHRRARGGRERLARDGHPVPAVQGRFLGLRERARDRRGDGLAEGRFGLQHDQARRAQAGAEQCAQGGDHRGFSPPRARIPSAGRRRGRVGRSSSTSTSSAACRCR
jgi:hypothetical protein